MCVPFPLGSLSLGTNPGVCFALDLNFYLRLSLHAPVDSAA